MNKLLWLGIVYGVPALVAIGIYLYDSYKYSPCPKCGNNFATKRIKGKIVCLIHKGSERKEKENEKNFIVSNGGFDGCAKDA